MTLSTPRRDRNALPAALLLLLFIAVPVAAETILLVDDAEVLYRAGTRRVIRPATRHAGNPLIKPTRPWEVQLAWNTVYREPTTGHYQMWYQSWNSSRDMKINCVVCYAESDDGIRWTKPVLDLFPFGNEKKTNIVLLGNGGHSYRYANSVVVDSDERDAQKRYKMAYFDWAVDEGVEYPGLCVAFSPDGIHWTKYPRAPLSRISYSDYEAPLPYADQPTTRPWCVPLSMADAVDVFFDPQRNVYAWYGKMWIDGPAGNMIWKHAMGRSESADFVHWSKPQLVSSPDDLDTPTVEFHTTPVFFHDGLYFCLNQILDRGTGGGVINIELMTSRDGLKWERNFRDHWWLARSSDATRFDSGSMFTNSTPVMLDNEMRFYYGGYRGGATGEDDISGNTGIGLATLPRDRFAGIEPVEKSDQPTLKKPLEYVGQVTFRPRAFDRCKSITINADASAGDVRLEILDETGRLVRGFTKDDSRPMSGDSLRHVAKWRSADLTTLPPAKYLLRAHLRHARLYALSIER